MVIISAACACTPKQKSQDQHLVPPCYSDRMQALATLALVVLRGPRLVLVQRGLLGQPPLRVRAEPLQRQR
ncbi:MAG TPA: hypothetical protein VKG65_00935 [Terriglobales bacterium]|nr:hypothetical protein [Terriglobales bacterium]